MQGQSFTLFQKSSEVYASKETTKHMYAHTVCVYVRVCVRVCSRASVCENMSKIESWGLQEQRKRHH